jgi:hypothetical protein
VEGFGRGKGNGARVGVFVRSWEQAGLLAIFQAVAFAADVSGRRMMQQAVQDRRCKRWDFRFRLLYSNCIGDEDRPSEDETESGSFGSSGTR